MPILDYPASVDGLRTELKQRRAAVPPYQRQQAAKKAWQHLQHWPPLHRAKNVACYLAMPGEFPTEAILEGLQRQGKVLYVPVIDPQQRRRMVFQRYRSDGPMRKNRFGIIEPVGLPRHQVAPQQLDLVLLPLLGFDHCGTRIGMGGGYYDTSFAHRLEKWRVKKTFLVGVAFDVQHCNKLVRNNWDVPVDAVLTESGIRGFS